jgi:hypothetical protein
MSDAAAPRPQFSLWQLLVLVGLIAGVLAAGVPWVRWMVARNGDISWPTVITLLLVVPGLVIGLGMRPLQATATSIKSAAISEALSHGIGLLGIIAMLCGVVGPFERVFREFDLDLPGITLTVLYVNHAATRYTDLVIPLAILTVLVDVAVFSLLYGGTRSGSTDSGECDVAPARRMWARLWSAAITAFLLGAMIGAFLALVMPLIVIVQKLTG